MQPSPDIRWRQRLQSFGRAYSRLLAAADLAKSRRLTELEQQGLIQAFEFTHELAWKTLKDFLESRGVTGIFGSRDTTREAFAQGLIAEGEEWMAMIAARNQSSHTYNEETANEISAAILASFVGCFASLLERMSNLARDTQ